MTQTIQKEPDTATWRNAVAGFERPSLPRSLGQIATSLIPYFALWVAMYYSLSVSYWITLALAIPAGGFLIRIFIICHDCGHGSFFKSKRANRIFGFICGVMPFIPSYYWSLEHAKHHAHGGDLDNRGDGDIWTLTVEEYLAAPLKTRIHYRIYRNPFVMFGIGPLYTFMIRYRFWTKKDGSRARRSTIETNLAILAIIVVASLTIGFKAYLMIQLPVMIVAGTSGVWLFYVQHQFETTYYERHNEWSYVLEALEGSSYYQLPRIFQFFSGNIGFHHVHHLSPRIPNYYLERCHNANAIFRNVRNITFWSSFKSLTYRMWDEERKHLVGWDYIKTFLAKQATSQR